jgi:hypothetical protein
MTLRQEILTMEWIPVPHLETCRMIGPARSAVPPRISLNLNSKRVPRIIYAEEIRALFLMRGSSKENMPGTGRSMNCAVMREFFDHVNGEGPLF